MFSSNQFIYFYNPSYSAPTPGDGQPAAGGWRAKAANMLYSGVKKKIKNQKSEIYTVGVELEFPRYIPDHLKQVSNIKIDKK